MKLLDLPADIVNILPHYFDSIYDLYNVLSTCRALYSAYRDHDARLPPIIPRCDGQRLFQPHPHLLLTCVARQIGDWAVSSPSNRYALYQTLLDGYDGLLSLAERVTLVSLSDLKRLHETKYSLLNPLTRLVDFEVGPAMVRSQDMDPAEYGLTICLHPDMAVLNYVIYCELFHHYVDDILASSEDYSDEIIAEGQDRRSGDITYASTSLNMHENSRRLSRPLEIGIRQRFIAYCLPDPNNHRHHFYNSLGSGRDDEWQLLDYIQMSQSTAVERRDEALENFWNTGVLQALPEDETVRLRGHAWDWIPSTSEKRAHLFVTVATHLGFESLNMLLLDGMISEEINARMKEIRTKIQRIPKDLIDGWEYWSHHQDPASEVSADGQRQETEWHAWLGMASDCHEGISTNGERDEDLQAEVEACESLLKLKMSADQLAIFNSLAEESANSLIPSDC